MRKRDYRGDSNARTQHRGSPLYALDPGVRLIRSTTENLPEIEQVISLVVFFRPVHGLLYLILMQRGSSIDIGNENLPCWKAGKAMQNNNHHGFYQD